MKNSSQPSQNVGNDGKVRVLVELRVPRSASTNVRLAAASDLEQVGLRLDWDYVPIRIPTTEQQSQQMDVETEEVVVVRGEVDRANLPKLRAEPGVVSVHEDTIIMPFAKRRIRPSPVLAPQFGGPPACPLPPCDCDPSTAKGTVIEAAKLLGADILWGQGVRGENVVVGIVDGGITAMGREPLPGETARVPRVIGGWPDDWGTTSATWGDHGNMTGSDVLSLAPEAKLYDIRIVAADIGGTISNALSGYDWALAQYRKHGLPQILSNSWGIYQESWDPVYARDADHPFTRKVAELVAAGITVVFAAGNCGPTCHDQRCGDDFGDGRAIWGANGSPSVVTVAAVNPLGQYIGYGSPGPAALADDKPDVSGVSHFKGYFPVDTGTSAATPTVAGVLALLKSAQPQAGPAELKAALREGANAVGGGPNRYTGSGVVSAHRALAVLTGHPSGPSWEPWESLGGLAVFGPTAAASENEVHVFAVGADHGVYHRQPIGDNGTDWERVVGNVAKTPGAAGASTGEAWLFVLSIDHGCSVVHWASGAWGTPTSLGGVHTEVAAATDRRGLPHVFSTGLDSAIYWSHLENANWSSWVRLSAASIAAPAVAVDGQGRMNLFAVGTDSVLYHRLLDGDQWSDWSALGGEVFGNPAATSCPNGDVCVVITGADSALRYIFIRDAHAGPWRRIEGLSVTAPSAVGTTDRLHIYAVDSSSRVQTTSSLWPELIVP